MSPRFILILAGLALLFVAQLITIHRNVPAPFPRSAWDLETTAQPRSVSPLSKRGNTAVWDLRGRRRQSKDDHSLPDVHFQASVISDDTVVIHTWIGPWPDPTVTLPNHALHPGETLTLTELADYGVQPVSMHLVPAKRRS